MHERSTIEMQFDLIVIGGGAAGFFGAIQAAETKPGLNVLILEKSNKVLSKVRISGGGRCNVTHNCFNPFELAHHYPRGEKSLKNLFKTFHAGHVVDWFASKGVLLKAEADGRMFPITDSSVTIIECFMSLARSLQIKLELGKMVTAIGRETNALRVACGDGTIYKARKILIATGGSPNKQSYDFITAINHTIHSPIPSLFTFNDSEKNFKDLMGVSVANAEVRIATTKFFQRGPVLITHWGLSGPAVIKLSAWAAEYLYKCNYTFTALVNWLDQTKEEELRAALTEYKSSKGKQKVISNTLLSLPQRLTQRLCTLAEIDEEKVWAELSKKQINRLVEFLIRCPFQIKGKTTFKEEFVTCGGVDLKEVHFETMASAKTQDVYFAGEVLNIDGETGGFNFQNAWSTAFVAARAIASDLENR
jgi:predicted Rossmann fold flavoprotein